MEGLAEYLRSMANVTEHKGDDPNWESILRRWASEVEAARAALSAGHEPTAWLHPIRQYADGAVNDLALSFSPNNFPLKGQSHGLFYATGAPTPLFAHPAPKGEAEDAAGVKEDGNG